MDGGRQNLVSDTATINRDGLCAAGSSDSAALLKDGIFEYGY